MVSVCLPSDALLQHLPSYLGFSYLGPGYLLIATLPDLQRGIAPLGLPAPAQKKVVETTRPFRYDLNQIPYDYTVEVRNRFKGLNLIDRVPDELSNEVRDIVQETGIKTVPMEKKCKKAKWGGLTNSCEKKGSERQRRKGKIYPFECRVPKNSKER